MFFIVYYFALPLLVGYAPQLMATKVFGVVNVAYLFALSQFFMAWLIAVALRARRRPVRHDGARTCVERCKRRTLMSPAVADVPRLHRDHAVDHLVGRAQERRARARYFAAGRSLNGWQNGIAVAGDYMSAASFLGIAGIIAFQGYDGFMYSVGWLVAYLTVLLDRRRAAAQRRQVHDGRRARLPPEPAAGARDGARCRTLTVSTFYMIAQMVGAGALVTLLLQDTGITYQTAVIGVGVLMIVYVVFGGMLATTWVQIIKAVLLMAGTILLSILVLAPLRLQLRRVLRRDRPSHVHERPGQRGHARFPDAGAALHAAVRRARPDLARHGADLRHRRAAAHPRALLHRARCARRRATASSGRW